jgi:hypothetical protein
MLVTGPAWSPEIRRSSKSNWLQFDSVRCGCRRHVHFAYATLLNYARFNDQGDDECESFQRLSFSNRNPAIFDAD